jgi:hypothetical protein
MFRIAYERACKFTFPIVQHVLTVEGKCSAGAAAFIVINSDGWIVTAAHVMKDSVILVQSEVATRNWEKTREDIKNDGSLSAKARTKKLEALGSLNKKAARRGASSWGFPFNGLFFRFGPKADYGKPYLLVKLPSSWPSKQYYQGMLVRRMVHK